MAESPTDNNSIPAKTVHTRWISERLITVFIGCVIVGLGVIGVASRSGSTTSATATPTAEPTFTPTVIPVQTRLETERCIAIAGDSAANGTVLFGGPSDEVYVMVFKQLNVYLRRSLADAGLADVEVRDRSQSAVTLGTSAKGSSYFSTTPFQSLLTDYCAVTIIMPWLNNLSIPNFSPEEGAAFYVRELDALVGSIEANDPNGKVIVLDYYFSKPQPFTKTVYPGYTPENVNYFNSQIRAACSGGSRALTQATCINTQDAFAGMDDSYLMSSMNYADIMANLADGAPLDRAADYFKQNPDGILVGDGQHLSPSGKAALADYLIAHVSQFFKTQ